MPYNTTAIPPRKEPTGQAQLPLSRIKRVIAQDADIAVCSNNAAFVITLAAEMFIQHLADEAHTQAKVDTKPRRNIQYKDVANAIARNDNLEFLEDVVPKTVPYKNIKASAQATQARLRGDNKPGDDNSAAATADHPPTAQTQLATNGNPIINGATTFSMPRTGPGAAAVGDEDPSEQLEMEMRQAQDSSRDGDVQMTG